MNLHLDGSLDSLEPRVRGLLDEALFIGETPLPDELSAVAVEALTAPEASPTTTVRDGEVNYSLTHLAPGLYEVTPPGGPSEERASAVAEEPTHVQVQLPALDLDLDEPELDPPVSYSWVEPEEEFTVELDAADDPAPPAAEPPRPVEAPPPRLPLTLATNAGMHLLPGDSAALTADHLRIDGIDSTFLIDIMLLSAPEQGVLLRDGFALTGGDVFTQEDIDRGRIVYRHEGDAGYDSFVFATPSEEIPATRFVLRIVPARRAPEVLGPSRLLSPLEGCSVAALLGANVRTHEPEVPPGLALTGSVGRGQWEYSQDGGASWQPICDMGSARALLLGPTYTLRFVPRSGWGGRVQLSFRVWDRSVGEAGTHADLSGPAATGGATAFSASTMTVTGTVQPTSLRVSVVEPWLTPSTVEELIGDGAAIVRLEGAGTWQFSLDGGRSWQDFGLVYHGRGRVLRPGDRVRFLPRKHATGRVTFSARPWDGTGAEPGDVIDLAGHRATGCASAFGEIAQTRTWRLGGE